MTNRPKDYAAIERKLLERTITPKVCNRLMDTISEETGVICECRLVKGNLVITAKDYTDYVLARAVAMGPQFRFAPANIAFVKHQADSSQKLVTGHWSLVTSPK